MEGYKVIKYPFEDFYFIPAACPNNHSFSLNWYSFKKGHRCKQCHVERVRRQEGVLPGKKMVPFEVVKEDIEGLNSDYQLITDISEYRGAGQPIKIKCPRSHVYITVVGEFRKGKRCKKCWHLDHSGEKHPMWNSSLSNEERFHRRDTHQHEEWRNLVLRRDGWKCVCCKNSKSKENRLHAHHLCNYKDFPEDRFDVKNGVTLCSKCHKLFHGIYGQQGATLEHFQEFSKSIGFDFEPNADFVFKKQTPTTESRRKKVLSFFSEINSLLTVEQVNDKLELGRETTMYTQMYTREILDYWCQKGILDRARLPLNKTGARRFHYFRKKTEVKQVNGD
jgi:hypothetical protein